MFGFFKDDGRPSLLGGTVKTAVIVGVLSYLAAGWLSSAADNETLARLAQNVSRGFADPLTTGSITEQATTSRLDPCAAPRADPIRRAKTVGAH